MQPDSGIKTWQWVATAIVIIVLIIIGIMVFGNKSSEAPATSDTTSSTTSSTNPASVNRIVMSDQYPGNVVYFSSVQLASPGWAVIQKDSAGKPGAIIGSTYFTAGINPGKVTLTQAMIDGSTYYAVLYSDNGDQKFDPLTDKPLTDSAGNIILHVFHASSSANAEIKG